MRDAVIVEAVRTPVGRRTGGLSGVHPADLPAHVLTSLVERAGRSGLSLDEIGAFEVDEAFAQPNATVLELV